MSKILTNNQYYYQIADAIREQNGTSNTYTPPQMVSALKDLFYEEVEGVPPISFNGIGENLLDYRIDGASGGVGERTSNLAKWDTHLMPQSNGIILSDSNAISSIINVTNINNVYIYGDNTKLNSNLYRIGKSNETISLNSQTTRIISTGGVLDTSDCNYIIVSCSIYNTQTTFDDIKNSFMVVEGSTEPLIFEPYGYKVPVVVNGKNLLSIITTPQTINEVTFTINSDKSITCNGTATNTTLFKIVENMSIKAGRYMLTGCPVGGGASTHYKLQLGYGSNFVADTGSGKLISFNEDTVINVIRIVIYTGESCENLTFYPMLRLNAIEDDTYELYHEPTTTNIYLEAPIEENESILLSDTNTNIPTIRGTNVLTVDTTVQPSNVYVKSRHESSYETAMRELYEEAQAQLDALESGGE